MRRSATAIIAAVALACLAFAVQAAPVATYSQNFESLNQLSSTALSADGWIVYGNVFNGGTLAYMYGYGPYPAPNGGSSFCDLDANQGGIDQGLQQLVVYSDYNNLDHGNGNIIESNVYREMVIGAADIGKTYTFAFDAKRGNIAGASTAQAFIKTLNPAAGYALTNNITLQTTAIPDTWANYSLQITIAAGMTGQLLQIGFSNQATFYESSGIYYDNVDFRQFVSSSVPTAVMAGAELRQNYPNPFNPSTKIEFVLERASNVDVSVFDLAGRLVATLQQGSLAAGDHAVVWDGNTDAGSPAAAGQYRYVLTTDAGRVSRSMMLVK